MRWTSLKKRSAIVDVLFHDFAFDVAIFLASYITDERANFLGRSRAKALRPVITETAPFDARVLAGEITAPADTIGVK
jgi:hypothetical protein